MAESIAEVIRQKGRELDGRQTGQVQVRLEIIGAARDVVSGDWELVGDAAGAHFAIDPEQLETTSLEELKRHLRGVLGLDSEGGPRLHVVRGMPHGVDP